MATTHSRRSESAESARRIIAQQVERLPQWTAPTRHSVIDTPGNITNCQKNRTCAGANAKRNRSRPRGDRRSGQANRIEQLLHDPISQLKNAEGDHAASAGPYLHALEKLFRLDVAQELREQSNSTDARLPTPTCTSLPTFPMSKAKLDYRGPAARAGSAQRRCARWTILAAGGLLLVLLIAAARRRVGRPGIRAIDHRRIAPSTLAAGRGRVRGVLASADG